MDRDDGLLDGIEDDSIPALPAALLVGVLLLEAAVLFLAALVRFL